MTEIIIGFSKSRSRFPLIGWLIQWSQKGRYSHTYLKIWNTYRKSWVVVDATAHGVRVGSLERFYEKNRPVKEYKFPVSEAVAESLLWWGIDRGRQGYSKWEILGNLLQLVFGLKKNIFRQGDKYTRCNELVALAVEEVLGIQIDQNLDDIDLIWLDEFLEKAVEQWPK